MTKPTYYETSFRFKWGIGFFIEMLSEGLKKIKPQGAVSYALENQVYLYDAKEEEFVESDDEIEKSTATNFVLNIDKALFDNIVDEIGTSNDLLKPQLITEFKERAKTDDEKKRLELLHETYDEMTFLNALLSYTDLSMLFPDEKTIIVEDPQPVEQNDDFQIV